MEHLSSTPTVSTGDLRGLAEQPGPFLTVVLPSPSAHDDAAHRLDVRWKNARRAAATAGWPIDRLTELDELVDSWQHGEAASFVIMQAVDGARLVETLMHDVASVHVSINERPEMITLLDSRQRTLPHVVVVADRAGADIAGFDGGDVVSEVEVEGERLHIHRGHPGGWSQRRFQQRAENTWEDNADTVVEAVADMAEEIQPVFVAIAGDVRATSLIEEGLRDRTSIEVVTVESGDPDGIAEEVLRLVDDQHARFLRRAIEALRSADGVGELRTGDDVIGVLREGRVETLFVHDTADHVHGAIDVDQVGSVDAPNRRLVDRALSAALETGAAVVVIPNVGELTDGVAATLRW